MTAMFLGVSIKSVPPEATAAQPRYTKPMVTNWVPRCHRGAQVLTIGFVYHWGAGVARGGIDPMLTPETCSCTGQVGVFRRLACKPVGVREARGRGHQLPVGR